MFAGTQIGHPGTIQVTKSVTRAQGLEDILNIDCDDKNPGRLCYCQPGYGNGNSEGPSSDSYFYCVACPKGFTSTYPLSQGACPPCQKGRYANISASVACTPCEAGKYGRFVGESDISS